MSIKTLNTLVLNKISGGGFTLSQLYDFLTKSGYFTNRPINFATFESLAIKCGINKILATPFAVHWLLTDEDKCSVSLFGRSLGIYTTKHFIKGFIKFLRASGPSTAD